MHARAVLAAQSAAKRCAGLACEIRSGQHDARLEPDLALERTDFSHSIGIGGETTPVGLIARLEHALDRIGAELEEWPQRAQALAFDREVRFPRFGPIRAT